MRVKAEVCWVGSPALYQARLTLPSGVRYIVPAGDYDGTWCRRLAARCKDLLEKVEGVRRDRIRFV